MRGSIFRAHSRHPVQEMFGAFVYITVFLFAVFAVTLFLLWRHKKAGMGEVNLVGALASVEESLAPEGAVLVRGELWRARLKHSGNAAEADADHRLIAKRGSTVRVVGANGYLLEVKLTD